MLLKTQWFDLIADRSGEMLSGQYVVNHNAGRNFGAGFSCGQHMESAS